MIGAARALQYMRFMVTRGLRHWFAGLRVYAYPGSRWLCLSLYRPTSLLKEVGTWVLARGRFLPGAVVD
jgi:hypothetical protein